jgi:predicted DNA-binding transcriptional regulator YafY
MARGDQMARSRLLERALANTQRGVSVRQWASDNGYGWRTVYRDLEALQKAGVPVLEVAPGRYGLDPGYKARIGATLSSEEVLALYSVRQLAAPWRHTSLGRAIDRVWAKLAADERQTRLVPSTAPDGALSIRSFVPIDYGRFHKYVETFEAAIAGRRAVVCRYRGLDGVEHRRTIEPGQLHFDPALGSLYVIAWCRLRGAVRFFAVHRFLAARLTDDVFGLRPETRSGAALRSAFRVWRASTVTRVRARFRGNAGVEVRERRWHSSQEVTDLGNGEIEVRLDVAGLAEVERWILGYGAEATAVEPEALVASIRRHHEEAARRYGAAAPPAARRRAT